MNSQEFKDMYESLVNLSSYLEEKNDPEPEEVAIVESVYQMVEKFKLLHTSLRKRVNSLDNKNVGGTLTRLYDKPVEGNTSVLF
jgi:hypothetical protein